MQTRASFRSRWLAASLLALSTFVAPPARAQLSDFLKRLPNLPATGAGPAKEAPASREAVSDAPPVAPPKNYTSEMAPDINCSRPRDQFNVSEKLTEYGGTAATLRFQRLITSDFQYSDLKPEDKQMLRYVAQTTVWVPPELEAKFAAAYDKSGGFFGRRDDALTEIQTMRLEDIQQRMTKIRETVAEYPADITLRVDKKLPDGAFARFGGLILISDRFLSGLGDAGSGADFLLAHEVSHVYKRHAMKQVQFQLISSSEGWGLAKTLLQGTLSTGGTIGNIGDKISALTTIPRLVELVRSVQLRFGREQELEADACSTVWLKAAGTNPNEAWTRYQSVLGANSTYADGHPATDERAARFTKRAAQDSAKAQRSTDKGTVKKEGQKVVSERPKS